LKVQLPIESDRSPSPPQFHQLNQRCWRRHPAADAELDKFSYIDPPASGFASCDPTLALPDPVGEVASPAISFLAYPGTNSATATAEGGVGMMTCGVQNMRNGPGDGGRLFACVRETAESLEMETIAVQLVAITVATNQEYYCFHAPDLGTLRKIADDVRRSRSIWEIPARGVERIAKTFHSLPVPIRF
jgi:hypothetical protein